MITRRVIYYILHVFLKRESHLWVPINEKTAEMLRFATVLLSLEKVSPLDSELKGTRAFSDFKDSKKIKKRR
jgi:hypothetical protein